MSTKISLKYQIYYLNPSTAKSTKSRYIIRLKYHWETMEEIHDFYFPVILKNDFKPKDEIDKRYPQAFL